MEKNTEAWNIISEVWPEIARKLDLKNRLIDQIRKPSTGTTCFQVDRVLTHWVSSKSDDATLQKLFDVLHGQDLKIAVDILKKRFDVTEEGQINSVTISGNSSTTGSDFTTTSSEFTTGDKKDAQTSEPKQTDKHIVSSNNKVVTETYTNQCCFQNDKSLRTEKQETKHKNVICNTERFLYMLSINILLGVVIIQTILFTIKFDSKVCYRPNTTKEWLLIQSTPHSIFDDNLNEKEEDVLVTSYTEVNYFLSNVRQHEKIHLFINMTSPHDWPQDFQVENAHLVTRLTLRGPFLLDIINKMVSQFSLLQYLTLDNAGELLCNQNIGHLLLARRLSAPSNLQSLKTINLKQFTCCYEIYDLLVAYFLKLNIAVWEIDCGIINDRNIFHLQEILCNSTTLHKVDFTMLYLTNLTLYKNRVCKSSIRRASLGNKNANSTDIGSYLGTHFCDAFEYIEVLSLLSYNEFKNIFVCKKMKALHAIVEINEADKPAQPWWKHN